MEFIIWMTRATSTIMLNLEMMLLSTLKLDNGKLSLETNYIPHLLLAQVETPPQSPPTRQTPSHRPKDHHRHDPPQTPVKPKRGPPHHDSSQRPTIKFYVGERPGRPLVRGQRIDDPDQDPGQGQNQEPDQDPEPQDVEQPEEEDQGAAGGAAGPHHQDVDPDDDDEGFIQGPGQDPQQDQGYQSGPQVLRYRFPGRPRLRPRQQAGPGNGPLFQNPWWSLGPPRHPDSAPGSEDPVTRHLGRLLERIESDLQDLREAVFDALRQARGQGPDPEKDYIPPPRQRRILM